jgi:hypothetical protein
MMSRYRLLDMTDRNWVRTQFPLAMANTTIVQAVVVLGMSNRFRAMVGTARVAAIA